MCLLLSDMIICAGCCSSLDHIVSYIFKILQSKGELHIISTKNFLVITFLCFPTVSTFPNKKLREVAQPENNIFLKVMEMQPEIFQNILSSILNILMFEDCKNQWSMSRPLLVLILLYEDYFR